MKKILIILVLFLCASLLQSCDRHTDSLLKGEIVAVLDECSGNEIIVSVSNNPKIGTYEDAYGNQFYIININDTIFEYNNVVAIPLHIDSEGVYRYSWHNKPLKNVRKGDYIEFEYRLLTEEDTMLYSSIQPCLTIYGPPSNIYRLAVNKIVKFNHQ